MKQHEQHQTSPGATGKKVAGSVSRRRALKLFGTIAAGGALVANAPVGNASHGLIGWHQTQKLVAHDGDDGDNFGRSVAIGAVYRGGERALVGAPDHFAFHSGRTTGAAYEFSRTDGGRWELHAEKVGTHASRGDGYGESVAMDADAIGAYYAVGMPEHRHTTTRTGAIDVFDAGVYGGRDEVFPEEGGEGDHFGHALAVRSGLVPTVFVGAPYDDTTAEDAGAVYFVTRGGGFEGGTGPGWSICGPFGCSLRPPADEAVERGYFGTAVAVAGVGPHLLVGAPGAAGSSGRAYLYRDDRYWTRLGSFKSGRSDTRFFGMAVALIDNSYGFFAVVGAPYEGRTGAAYVFEHLRGNVWSRDRLVPSDGGRWDAFGSSVAINSTGTTVLVGSHLHDPGDHTDAGAAYVFSRIGRGEWTQSQKLLAEDRSDHDHFGDAVALSHDGGTALIGAPRDDNAAGPDAGAVYSFEFTIAPALLRILDLYRYYGDELFR